MLPRMPGLFELAVLAVRDLAARWFEWWRDPAVNPKSGDLWTFAAPSFGVWAVESTELGRTILVQGRTRVTVLLPYLRAHGRARLVTKRPS